MVTEVGMIARQHKNSVFKPWLARCRLEEFAYRHIRIANTFMDDELFFGEALLIFFGNDKGMMARCSKQCCHERLFHFSHLRSIILHKRFIPYSPCTVEIFITAEAFVLIEVFSAVIVLESGLRGKCLKAHRSALCTMEECCLVAFPCQHRCQTAHIVH